MSKHIHHPSILTVLATLALSALSACASAVTLDGGSDTSVPNDAQGFPDGRPVIDTGLMSAAAISCPSDAGAVFPASLALCSNPTECVAVVHGLDCCGSIEYVGINLAQRDAFAVPENSCEAIIRFNMCDCLVRPPLAQDGRAVPAGTVPPVQCVGGMCLTHVP